MYYFKVKVSLTASMLEARVLVKLGIFSLEGLDIFMWWSRLASKTAVPSRMYLVVDMDIDVKRAIMPNTFGITFPFFYFS